MFGETWPDEPDPPFPEYVDPFPAYSEPVPEEIGRGARRTARRSRPYDDTERRYGPDPDVVAAVESGYLGLVAVFRVGLFALALGGYLLAFRGGYYAQVIAAVGLVTCVYGVHRYLVYRRVLGERGPPEE